MATHFKGPLIVTGTGTGSNAGNQTVAGTLAVTGATTLTGAATLSSTATVATSLAVGGGTAITKIVKGTFVLDAADLASVTAVDESITVSGAAVGDIVVVCPPATALTAGMLMCQAWVSATNTVKVRLYNGSVGAINLASLTFDYCLIRS